MTKRPDWDETEEVRPVKSPRVKAVCPINEAHAGARVYRTAGRIRYCVCDTCGNRWCQAGPEAGSPKT